MGVELRIEGMTCQSCARRLESALRSVPGVVDAEVGYPGGHGRVTATEGVAAADLLRAVERAGYRASVAGGGEGGFDHDLLVVGTGAAGMAAVIRAAELGVKAAVVEGAEVVGGTCVNVGCIPSKSLIEAAQHLHTARSAFPGIEPCDPRLVWREVQRQKREIVETLRQERYHDVLAAHEGVTLLRGRARLLGGQRVRVGERVVSARKIVLATGTSPALPAIPGLAEVDPLDSTSVMELPELPASLVVIGAGAVGLELGQALARFGVRVVVVEAMERILPTEDPDVATALERALRAEGVEIHVGARVAEVARGEDGGVVLRLRSGSGVGEIRAERVLVATGRAPNTRDLGLEAAGVATDAQGFIRVDDLMRTSNPDIHAAGDVTGGPGYVYVAAYGGGIAAQAALAGISGEEPIAADLSATPRVTFTDPQVAAVGMTEQEARAAGLVPKVTAMPAAYLPRAIVAHRTEGLVKLVADAASDRLLGVHLVLPNAGDVIGEATLAVRSGLRVGELVSALHPYLTWTEGLKLAGQTFTRDVARLSCCA